MEAVKGGTLYKDPKIERAVISHFKIYEVSDMELDSLKEAMMEERSSIIR